MAQEAFVRAHRALDRFRGEAEMSTWLHRILLNEARRRRRWRWVRERLSGAMPQGQREAFLLVHLEGPSASEVAAITGRATGTIKSHLHRALRALRADLGDLDPALEATGS